MKTKTGQVNWLLVVGLLIIAFIIAGLVLFHSGNPVGNTAPAVQTLLGQNQQPAADDQTAGWLTYIDARSDILFKYPAAFGANVWHAQFWPPKATVVPASQDPVAIGCPDLALGGNTAFTAVDINNTAYTLYTGQDAGAGQLYNSYCYVAQKGQNYYVMYFVIWSANGCGDGNCGPYCGTPYEAECRNLDRAPAIEQPIQKIVSTLQTPAAVSYFEF